ncbi:MAG: UbiA family prenyltransferase, partial [Halobacteriota archaeon]
MDTVSVSVERLTGLLEVTRPANAVLAGFAAAVGALVAGFETTPAATAATATALGTMAGNAVNDYYDVDVDRVNRPDRPIPRGAIARRDAAWLAAACFAVAVTITVALLPALAVAIGVVNLVLLVVYSSHLKRTPLAGNVVVAYLSGSAFLFGGAAVGDVEATLVLFGLASLVSLGREIVKDVEDMEGDREAGASTLPVAWGAGPSLVLASASVGVAAGLAPLPYLFGGYGGVYLSLVGVAVALALAGAAVA